MRRSISLIRLRDHTGAETPRPVRLGLTFLLLATATACSDTPERTGDRVEPSSAPTVATSSAPPPPFAIGPPENLGPLVNGPGFDGGPSLSVDGLELYFVSDRLGGHGGGDIWVARRSAPDKPFEVSENLGDSVNSAGNGQVHR